MNKRPEEYSSVNRYATDNRYTQQGNYSQQASRQNVRMSNTQQQSRAIPNARRTFSKPQKRSFANRIFKDRRGKLNVLGKVAVGALTISTLAGFKYAYDALSFNSFVHGEDYQKIVEAIQDNYDNSEYLQVSIPRDAYDEYTDGTLKNAIKNEPNMQNFLRTEEFDPTVWAYLLTGEVDRSEMSNEEILTALQDYLPYAKYDRDSKNEEVLDNNISNFAIMSQYCMTDKNKNSVVNLLDSVIGLSSLSNSKDALECKVRLNNEEIERIEHNTQEELINKCYVNSNFDKLAHGQDSTEYFRSYVYDFYNSRVSFVQEKLKSADAPQLLKEALMKYSDYEKMDGVSKELRSQPSEIMKAKKIADYEEYKKYSSLRNNFYNRIIVEQKTPEESTTKIEVANIQLENRIGMQSVVEKFDIPQYMSETNQLIEDMHDSAKRLAEVEEEQNRINKRAKDLGFDGFDR